jgi:hypothetical protein
VFDSVSPLARVSANLRLDGLLLEFHGRPPLPADAADNELLRRFVVYACRRHRYLTPKKDICLDRLLAYADELPRRIRSHFNRRRRRAVRKAHIFAAVSRN